MIAVTLSFLVLVFSYLILCSLVSVSNSCKSNESSLKNEDESEVDIRTAQFLPLKKLRGFGHDYNEQVLDSFFTVEVVSQIIEDIFGEHNSDITDLLESYQDPTNLQRNSSISSSFQEGTRIEDFSDSRAFNVSSFVDEVIKDNSK